MLVAASGQHILESGTETVGFALREAQWRHEPQRRRGDRVDEDAARPQCLRHLGCVAAHELDPEQQPGSAHVIHAGQGAGPLA